MQNLGRNFTLACLILTSGIFIESSRAAVPTYLQLSGISGEVTQPGREGWMEVYGFSHEIVSPRDPASGLPTGKRQHTPFRVVLAHSDATVALNKILVENGTIPSAIISLWKTTANGTEIRYFKYELQNVRVVSVRPWQANRADRTAAEYPPMLEVSFTYQKIIWSSGDGGVQSQDTWESQN